jgi:hypothetical protein
MICSSLNRFRFISGSLAGPDSSVRWRSLRGSRQLLKENPELAGIPAPGKLTAGEIAALREEMSKVRKKMLGSFYCSCWHMNEHESAAMWRLYCQSNEAICIQSTFELLEAALPDWVNVGVVRYIDYELDTIEEGNLFNPVMTKRKSFEHEREVRAIALAWPQNPECEVSKAVVGDVVRVPVDLTATLLTVRVSPTSPEWYRNVVDGLLAKFNLPLTVGQSSLDAKPLF